MYCIKLSLASVIAVCSLGEQALLLDVTDGRNEDPGLSAVPALTQKCSCSTLTR